MKWLKQFGLIDYLAAGTIFLVVLIMAANAWLAISDPCVEYQYRGYYMVGNVLEPNKVCVARKSGWREVKTTNMVLVP